MAETGVAGLSRRRGVAYIMSRSCRLFCRELFVAPRTTIGPCYQAPALREDGTAGDISPSALNGQLDGGPVASAPGISPMIDGLSCPGPPPGTREASRSFSRQNDLWIADHRPSKSLAPSSGLPPP